VTRSDSQKRDEAVDAGKHELQVGESKRGERSAFMKKKGIASVVLMVVVLAAAPVLALDPIIIGPIIVLPPCLFADFSADVETITSVDVQTGADFWISVDNFDITQDGATVGRMISHYQRLSFGATNQVVKEDTAIIDTPSLKITVFGRAYNSKAGHAGARGVIVGAIDNSGNAVDLKGTYIITDSTPRKICAFLTP
jgi:hypothetical protein